MQSKDVKSSTVSSLEKSIKTIVKLIVMIVRKTMTIIRDEGSPYSIRYQTKLLLSFGKRLGEERGTEELNL